MRLFTVAVKGISTLLYWLSSVAIVSIVLLTVFDVIMRKLERPVDFAVETVCLLAGIVIAFALPATSLSNDHAVMEFIENKLTGRSLRVVRILTRCLGIALFLLIGLSAFKLGNTWREAGQCSPILQIPEFPIPYALGAACFVECMVLFILTIENPEQRSSL
ncbi:MAG TPA: TRAP transporter small permease [Syntrophorhabdaceae bacterium]|nr:TRAP transporter small permease [Syntrophorhabdaceae bacterium]